MQKRALEDFSKLEMLHSEFKSKHEQFGKDLKETMNLQKASELKSGLKQSCDNFMEQARLLREMELEESHKRLD